MALQGDLIFHISTEDANEDTLPGESDQSEKSFTLGLKGFSLLHSSPPDQSVLIIIIIAVMIGEECDILLVLLKTNQRVS